MRVKLDENLVTAMPVHCGKPVTTWRRLQTKGRAVPGTSR